MKTITRHRMNSRSYWMSCVAVSPICVWRLLGQTTGISNAACASVNQH